MFGNQIVRMLTIFPRYPKLVNMFTTPESEFAWAVGIFEGEGCISINRTVGRHGTPLLSIRLRVAMRDEDVVRRFRAAVGIGEVVRRRQSVAHYEPLFWWSAQRREDVVALLERFLPYLGTRRRAKSLEALRAHTEIPAMKPHMTRTSWNQRPRERQPCSIVINGDVCGRPIRSLGLCTACYKRAKRGGFLSKICKPWETQKLRKQTRAAARKAFQ